MTEDDYIKREAALEAIDRIRLEVWLIDIPSPTVPEYIEHHEGIQHVLGEIDALRKKMEQLPGIDKQKTGRWIKTGRWGRVYKCNQCGNFLDFEGVNVGRGSTNFCPNCGAWMENSDE